MPAVHIRDVPEPVLAALKERAARHERSVQQELREILSRAAAEPVDARRPEPLHLVTVDTGSTSTTTRTEIYGDDGR